MKCLFLSYVTIIFADMKRNSESSIKRKDYRLVDARAFILDLNTKSIMQFALACV